MGCEEYKQDDEIDALHNCPVHRKPCIHRQEENFFFRLSSYQQQLEVRMSHLHPAIVVSPVSRCTASGFARHILSNFHQTTHLAIRKYTFWLCYTCIVHKLKSCQRATAGSMYCSKILLF